MRVCFWHVMSRWEKECEAMRLRMFFESNSSPRSHELMNTILVIPTGNPLLRSKTDWTIVLEAETALSPTLFELGTWERFSFRLCKRSCDRESLFLPHAQLNCRRREKVLFDFFTQMIELDAVRRRLKRNLRCRRGSHPCLSHSPPLALALCLVV